MDKTTITREIPDDLVQERISKLQLEMGKKAIDGMLLTQNIDLYYYTGSMQNGYAFVPAEGMPVFFVKRSLERARLETLIAVEPLGSFRQFGQTLAERIPQLFKAGGSVTVAADLDVLPAQTYFKLNQLLQSAGAVELVDGSALIRGQRMIKSPWEIKRIETAAKAVDEALGEALNVLKEGITELAWIARVEYELRLRGHIGLMRMRGYNQEVATGMVTSGAAAAVPTYFDGPAGGLGLGATFPQSVSHRVIGRNEPILIDVGCCIDGYIIDQTRTAVIGQLSEQLAHAYRTSEEMMRAAEKGMVPGTPCSELYIASLDQAAAAGLSAHYMGFGLDQAKFLGHGIGLEIDEWPVLARGFDLPLASGMVLAVEPKFTFPGQGVVGVENSYVITDGTPRQLTRTKEQLIVLP